MEFMKQFTNDKEVNNVRPIDSVVIYRPFWMCFSIVGINSGYNKFLCGFYDFMMTIFVTVAYPLHLTIGLFMVPTFADLFKNLAINVTCIACSIKHFVLRYKLKDIQQMQHKLAELDERATDVDERAYFHEIPQVQAKRVIDLFFFTYTVSNVAAAALALLSAERRLMYPAYFPFDWRATDLLYWLTFGYQFYGITMQIVQNLANDIFVPMSLCIISGHVRLLRMRIAKIGHRVEKSMWQHRRDFIACIHDHQNLIEVLQLLQRTIFYAQLVQFLSSGLIFFVTLVYLLFYSDNIFAYIYYTVYFIAMGIEIFPCCYYGSLLQQELYELSYAMFNSNWPLLTSKYKKDYLIFTQLTLRDIKLTAGGFIGINLNAFFGTCKMAYSMFAVVLSSRAKFK